MYKRSDAKTATSFELYIACDNVCDMNYNIGWFSDFKIK